MTKKIANSFTSYEMTEQEELQASSFTDLQIQYLNNQLAMVAEEKIRLIFDEQNPSEFAKQIAYKQAELDVYTHLIEQSAASKIAVTYNSTQQLDNQV